MNEEQIEKVRELEALLDIANEAEGLVEHLLEEMRDHGFEEPHGWLSLIIFNLRTEIEEKKEEEERKL